MSKTLAEMLPNEEEEREKEFLRVHFLRREKMMRGEIPDDYIYLSRCTNCGEVWLPINSALVFGCPWCTIPKDGEAAPW